MAFSSTWGAANNALASSALGASASTSFTLDYSSVAEGRLMVENTPGAAISTVRGITVQVFVQRGPSGSGVYSTFPFINETLPSQLASTREAKVYFLPAGKFNVTLTNLDTAHGVTVAATSDSIS